MPRCRVRRCARSRSDSAVGAHDGPAQCQPPQEQSSLKGLGAAGAVVERAERGVVEPGQSEIAEQLPCSDHAEAHPPGPHPPTRRPGRRALAPMTCCDVTEPHRSQEGSDQGYSRHHVGPEGERRGQGGKPGVHGGSNDGDPESGPMDGPAGARPCGFETLRLAAVTGRPQPSRFAHLGASDPSKGELTGPGVPAGWGRRRRPARAPSRRGIRLGATPRRRRRRSADGQWDRRRGPWIAPGQPIDPGRP
jgi:hypothetical protein